MRRLLSAPALAMGLAATVIAGPVCPASATAAEIHFVAGEVSKDRPIWHPQTVIIDESIDLSTGMVFVLENPTDTKHGFAVTGTGIYEQVEETITEEITPGGGPVEVMTYHLRPIRVIVNPGETKRLRINVEHLKKSTGQRFRVWCPIHKDMHLGGAIFVER